MSTFAPAPEPATPLGRLRVLSPSCGLRVSPLQLGAMSIGDAWSSFMGTMDKEKSFKLLDAFYDAGGNFVDTANNYQDGQSEQYIGEWMQKRQNRDEMVIATKFTTMYKPDAKNIRANYCGNSVKSMNLSVEASLKKLQTSYIDILYLHWYDWTSSIEEIMIGLNNLVKSGKVLYLGISDTPAWVVSSANRYARDHGLSPFVIYQGRWNVLIRDLERDVIPMVRHEGMAIAPWDAIGGGKFQTKEQLEERKNAGEGLRSMMGNDKQTEDQVRVSENLDKVARELGVGIQAVALAYVQQKVPYVFPIVGGRKVEHLMSNIDSLKITLTPEHIKTLESGSSFDIGFPMNFIGQDPTTNGGETTFLMNFAGTFDFPQAGSAIKGHGQK